jgi:hypothetical protein
MMLVDDGGDGVEGVIVFHSRVMVNCGTPVKSVCNCGDARALIANTDGEGGRIIGIADAAGDNGDCWSDIDEVLTAEDDTIE